MSKSKNNGSFELSFEEAYAKLETIAETLESGNLTLEEATSLYQKGITLARISSKILNDTELKIHELKSSFSKDIEDDDTEEYVD